MRMFRTKSKKRARPYRRCARRTYKREDPSEGALSLRRDHNFVPLAPGLGDSLPASYPQRIIFIISLTTKKQLPAWELLFIMIKTLYEMGERCFPAPLFSLLAILPAGKASPFHPLASLFRHFPVQLRGEIVILLRIYP